MRGAKATRDVKLPSASASFWIGFGGAVWLAVATWFFATHLPDPFYGAEIYDLYYASILDGRLDLPPRVLRFEGHYAADGTGYLYQGIAPLLTRFAFGWAWPFSTFSLAGPSIWLWAVLGTAGYQSGLLDLAHRAGLSEARRKTILTICAGLWFAGPGPLLVANHSFYHEPIAVAFGATGAFIGVWAAAARGRLAWRVALVILALLAVVAFHARPNVALGLYIAVFAAVVWRLWQHRTAVLMPAFFSCAVLGAGVAGFLALNEARFGSATQLDGSFSQSPSVYGTVFWGRELPDSERARSSEEHGRFNALRIAPNAALYLFDVVELGGLAPLSRLILETHEAVTKPMLGWIRVEGPRIGLVYLWPLWLYLAFSAAPALRRDPTVAILACGLSLSTLLTLSYATVSFRYRFDLWPLVGLLCSVGLVWTQKRQSIPSSRTAIFIVLFIVGAALVWGMAYIYSHGFREIRESRFYFPWTYEFCADRAAWAGFEGEDIARICRDPSLDAP